VPLKAWGHSKRDPKLLALRKIHYYKIPSPSKNTKAFAPAFGCYIYHREKINECALSIIFLSRVF